MTTTPPAIGLAERYERDVLPRLIEHLDRAFPEFGFIRDRDGWIATNDQTTHALLGCRANRVVCHGNTPRGILIHGQGPVLFTTLANQMRPARGRDLAAYQGNDAWLLPIPATFVLDREGVIRMRHVDPDYRLRPPVEEILAELRKLVQ